MSLQTIQWNLRKRGLSVAHNPATKEYRINFTRQGEATAQYTKDIRQIEPIADKMLSALSEQ